MIATLRGSDCITKKYFLCILSYGCHHQKGREYECMCMKVLMMPRWSTSSTSLTMCLDGEIKPGKSISTGILKCLPIM